MISDEDPGTVRLQWALAAICLLTFCGALVIMALVSQKNPLAPLLSGRIMVLTFGLPSVVSLAVAYLYVYRLGRRRD